MLRDDRNYTAGLINYADTGGVRLQGVGTASDFYTFVTGLFRLEANPFSASSITIESDQDIVVDLKQNLFKTSNTPGNSLNFLAGRDISYDPHSFTIGKLGGTPGLDGAFNNVLTLTAARNITLENSLYMNTQDLTLRAGASYRSPFVGNVTGDPGGSVTLLGNYSVQTGGSVTVSGKDFSLLGGATGREQPLISKMSLSGQELTAGETVNLLNNGVINLQAGTATAGSAGGARLKGDTVRIGVPGAPNNPKQLTIQGGVNDVGIESHSRDDLFQADAVLEAKGSMFVYLGGDKNLALPAPLAGLDAYPPGAPYSLLVRGGEARTNGQESRLVTAIGALRANDLVLVAEGSLVLQGGVSTVDAAASFAATDALILVKNSKDVTTHGTGSGGTGSVFIRGGKAVVTGDPRRAQNTSASAGLDPADLTMNIAGNLVLQGGTGPTGSVTSARIDAANEMRINVYGPPILYTYTTSTGAANTLFGKAFMIGGVGSGIFDKNFVPLTGLASPITFNVAVVQTLDRGLGDAVIQTGRSVFDSSLLNYSIFAANEAAAARRLRRLSTDDDPGGAAACQ